MSGWKVFAVTDWTPRVINGGSQTLDYNGVETYWRREILINFLQNIEIFRILTRCMREGERSHWNIGNIIPHTGYSQFEFHWNVFSQPVPLRGGLRQGVTLWWVRLCVCHFVGASVCVSLRGCVCVCVTSWVRLCVCHFVGASVCVSVCLSVTFFLKIF